MAQPPTLYDDLKNIVALQEPVLLGLGSHTGKAIDFLYVWVDKLTECDAPSNDFLESLSMDFIDHRDTVVRGLEVTEPDKKKLSVLLSAIGAQMIRRCSSKSDVVLEDALAILRGTA